MPLLKTISVAVPFLRKQVALREHHVSPLLSFNQLTDFHEILLGRYVIGGYVPTSYFISFL
jgi:hypothetical protein